MNSIASVHNTQVRREFWLFILFAFFLLGAGIGLRDPWPSDEPRFTLVAKQMVESGDWLFPHRGSELYSDKPPMLMWLEAISYEIFHSWRIAFLLPSLLAGLLTLILTYDLGRRLWNPRVGLYAAGILLTVFQFVYKTKRAQIDPLIMGIITLANWGLLLHFLRGPNWRLYWLGCFAAGVGVITKGVGILALLMFLPYIFARKKNWRDITYTTHAFGHWALGGLLFLLPILLWAVPMILIAHTRHNPEYDVYVSDILFRQTAKRYADSWSHAQPFWYFLPIILFNWFPMSLAYFNAIPRWREAFKNHDARILLPIAWTLLIIIFFSIPTGKRDVYVMPALPMIALAIAPYLAEMLQLRWLRTLAFTIGAVGGIAFLVGGLWAMYGHPPAAQRLIEQRGLNQGGTELWGMLIATGIFFLICSAWFRARRGVHALLTGLVGFWLLWSFWVYPVLNDSSSAALVMRRTGEVIGPDSELGLVAWKEQNLLLADRPARDFGFLKPWPEQYSAAIQWQSELPTKRWIFILDEAMGNCVDRAKAKSVGHANRREWWVFEASAVIPGCTPEIVPEKDEGDGL